MNARQEAKLAMYRAIEKLFDDFTAIIGAVPAFQTAVINFKAIIARINGITQLKDVPLTGITDDKIRAKQTLCRTASEVAGFISAYASVTGNDTLKQEVNFNLSKLLKTRDDQLVPRCQNIHDHAAANKSELTDYGITPAKLAELQTAIDKYSAQTPNPRSALNQRKTQVLDLREQFNRADTLLKDVLDKLALNFKTSNPDFVTNYFAGRTIIDAATTATRLKGKVTDQSTGAPLKDATITIIELAKTTKTNAAGDYNLKPISHGTYTITVAKTGYETMQIEDFQLKLGQVTVLDVDLMNS